MPDDVPIASQAWKTASGARRKDIDALALSTMQAYRAGAGLVRGDDAVAQARHGDGIGVVQLARWIVRRRVLMFEWRSQTWLPCFQFHWPEIRLRDEPAPVFAALAPIYSSWEVARWFVQPHVALDQRLPVDVVPFDPAAVLAAACADRDATQRVCLQAPPGLSDGAGHRVHR